MKTAHHIITIGRQVGSGGRLIGKLMAEKLGYAFYDREILARAAKESGIKDEFFERTDEVNSIFSRLTNYFTLDPFSPHTNYLSPESLFKFQSDAIRMAAGEGPAIFVGRCSDYILRDFDNRTDIFITADIADRVQRAAQYFNLTPEEAAKKIEKQESAREEYYNFFTDKKWGAAAGYHLCFSSTGLTLDECVDTILEYINRRKL